jgi:hypothetical protein
VRRLNARVRDLDLTPSCGEELLDIAMDAVRRIFATNGDCVGGQPARTDATWFVERWI